MIYILLTFFAALFLEGIGTIISIHGLTLLFGVEPLIITLAIAFDFAKLVAVSILYKEWKELPKQLKYYMVIASIVLMTITSAGGAGYLSASSQKALLPTKSLQVKVDALIQEKEKLESRKRDIDNQITNLPSDMVKGRTKLIANFKEELNRVNTRIVALDEELPKAQVELIEKSSHAGPITSIAEATQTSAERAMGIIIGFIIFVFDPLAVALIIAGNYLIAKRKQKLTVEVCEKIIEEAHHQPVIPIIEEPAISRLEEDLEINNIDIPEEEPPVELVNELLENLETTVETLTRKNDDNTKQIIELRQPVTEPVEQEFDITPTEPVTHSTLNDLVTNEVVTFNDTSGSATKKTIYR